MPTFTVLLEESAPAKYAQYYLKYNSLKDVILQMAQERNSQFNSQPASRDFLNNELPIGRFQELLQEELAKVNQFACIKHEDIFLSLSREAKMLGKGKHDAGALRSSSTRIEALADEIVHLDSYVRLNYMGFQKLTQKFDSSMGVSGSSLFVAGLQSESFCNVRFDDILILLGLSWARWRAQKDSAEQSKDATWVPPESFIRNTAKYWVRPDQVVLLKTRLVRELPYLIFGASAAEQEKLLEPFALLDLDYDAFDVQSAIGACSGTMEESQLLSSVYFDSPDGICFSERIRREEGARLVRFRWYGENHQETSKDIYVERKIHHEGWGSLSSAKERAIIPQSDIFNFMKGKLDIDGYFKRLADEGVYSEKGRRAMKGIAHEVNEMIRAKKLQPIIRTSYYRCAFQLATDNKVRVSLDTQMTLLNEIIKDGHPVEPWCHIGSDLLAKNEIYRFPFAILEIKLQDVTETPKWLRKTLSDIGAIQVHKFSKFQHAMAFLHPQRCSIMPHWSKEFEEWHRRRDDQVDGAVTARLRTESQISHLSRSFDDMLIPQLKTEVAPQGEGHRLKDMMNLDPKAVFANERTLLHYAEKGVYLGLAAIAMQSQTRAAFQVTGAILSAAVVLFYIWVLCEYYSRLNRIHARASAGKTSLLRLDWAHGPLIVVSLLFLSLAISMASWVANANTPPPA